MSAPSTEAREYVIRRLAACRAAVFAPVGGAAGVDLAVRAGDGTYVEIVIREPASPDRPRSFPMARFRPRPHLFVVGVAPGPEAWIVPSTAFERFASGAPGEPEWDLDLDGPTGEPLSERLGVYRERWSLIAEYATYRSTLGDPVALQVRIAMG